MRRQWKEDSKYKYCVLGPHRIIARGYKIGSRCLSSSFKAYVGESWTVFHPEAELCSKCQAKVRNFGRKLGLLPETSNLVQANEDDAAPGTPDGNEVIEDNELSEVGSMPMPVTSSEGSSVSSASFYSAQDITPRSHNSAVTCHYSGSEGYFQEDTLSGSSAPSTFQLTSITACTLSQRYCMICGEEGKDGRHRIPKKVVHNLWHTHRILASTESRSCLVHHDGIQLSESAISTLETSVKKRTINLD